MTENKKTSIQISVETKDRLNQLGLKGDTYDQIIIRLLEKASKKRRQYQ